MSSRMIDSYTSKSCYVYDYIVNQQGRPEKHIKVRFVAELAHVRAPKIQPSMVVVRTRF